MGEKAALLLISGEGRVPGIFCFRRFFSRNPYLVRPDFPAELLDSWRKSAITSRVAEQGEPKEGREPKEGERISLWPIFKLPGCAGTCSPPSQQLGEACWGFVFSACSHESCSGSGGSVTQAVAFLLFRRLCAEHPPPRFFEHKITQVAWLPPLKFAVFPRLAILPCILAVGPIPTYL